LNLTAANFGGQLNNIEAYRSALDQIVRTALVTANQSSLSNITSIQGQQIEIPVHIITSFEEQNQQQTSTTTTATTDTREYTEKRIETKDKR
jgi:hypothetical protein